MSFDKWTDFDPLIVKNSAGNAGVKAIHHDWQEYRLLPGYRITQGVRAGSRVERRFACNVAALGMSAPRRIPSSSG